jgi:hypothetical protein
MKIIDEVTGSAEPMRLDYTEVVAADAAVIAVAAEPNPVAGPACPSC